MKKIFVMDTNVLLHDPRSLFAFEDNEVVIPLVVLDELDKKKVGAHDETARHARMVIRSLDKIRKQGNIHQGVPTPAGGSVRVELNYKDKIVPDLDPNRIDNRLISVALGLKDDNPNKPVTLITKDINLRVKCDALGVVTEDYNADSVAEDASLIYEGSAEVLVTSAELDLFYKDGTLNPTPYGTFIENQYILLKSTDKQSHSALARYSGGVFKKLYIPKSVWGICARNKEQAYAFDALFDPEIKIVTLIGLAGSGKAQPNDSKVLTKDGWIKMGDISVGQELMCPDGNISRVLSVHPQGKIDVYKVFFSDGTHTECCNDHLWLTKTSQERWGKKDGKVRSLDEIRKTLILNGKRNHSIPMVGEIDLGKEKHLNIDPYLLGCLLGDGSFSHFCSFSNADQDIVENVDGCLDSMGLKLKKTLSRPYDYTIIRKGDRKYGFPCGCFEAENIQTKEKIFFKSKKELKDSDFCCSSVYKCINGKYKQHKGYVWKYIKTDKKSTNPLKDFLIKNGLFGKKSEEKFIPREYLFSSFDNRVSLLQGLMDTNGTIEKKNCTYISTSSNTLKENIRFLGESLGCKVTVQIKIPKFRYKGEIKIGKKNYIVRIGFPNNIKPFRCKRKDSKYIPKTKYKPTRYIDRVEYIGKKESSCIYIDDKKHLYVTNNFIVTHNTLISAAAGVDQLFDKHEYKKLILTRPVQPLGRDIGFLPGDIDDKMKPWMAPLQDNLDLLFADKGSGWLDMKKDDGTIQVEALTYIRGRSIPKSFIILDEAQNLTLHEIKTIITRIGEGSKIVLTGDVKQIDNPFIDAVDNGLTCAVEKFKHKSIAAHVTLKKGERSELATMAAEIL